MPKTHKLKGAVADVKAELDKEGPTSRVLVLRKLAQTLISLEHAVLCHEENQAEFGEEARSAVARKRDRNRIERAIEADAQLGKQIGEIRKARRQAASIAKSSSVPPSKRAVPSAKKPRAKR
ncbi:MAG: hypothetical protein IPJ33_22470 [Gammaproteobacteria bacterium]|nr:hypothetical protein [Gammaproteobacteria bacterium]